MMSHRCISVVLWATSLAFLLLEPNRIHAAVPVNHVFLVSLDGLSATCLRGVLATNSAACPHLARLIREGASTLNARCDFAYSETVPNHTTMWLARPVAQPEGLPATVHHGYHYNVYNSGYLFHNAGNPNVSYFFSVFDVVHDHGLTTAFFAGKAKLAVCYDSYNETNGAPDLIGEDNGRNKLDHTEILDWNGFYDPEATGINLTALVTNYLASNAPNFMFVHLADMDYQGHYTGWGSDRYLAELTRIDSCLGRLLAALEANPALSGQTTLIVTTDHGGGDPPSTHIYPERPLNYTIPFIVWGPGWPARSDAYRCFLNRVDPGTNRVDYVAAQQPLRNGDASNLALALLGLPPIPGSFIQPVLRPQLTFRNQDGQLVLSWPSAPESFMLEQGDALDNPAAWELISTGIADDGTTKSYTVLAAPTDRPHYYRLRDTSGIAK